MAAKTDRDTRPVRVLVVPADEDEPVHTQTMPVTHELLCRMVEDYNTDAVFLASEADAGIAYVAATAKSRSDAARNPRATILIDRFRPGFARHDYIAGPAVILGIGADGKYLNVPDSVVAVCEGLFNVQHD